MEHRSTPDNGLISGIQKSYRDNFQSMRQNRLDPFITDRAGLGTGPDHQGNVGPVYICVQQTDLMPKLRQSQREVHRKRGLPDSALAGTNGDDVSNSRQSLRARRLLTMLVHVAQGCPSLF